MCKQSKISPSFTTVKNKETYSTMRKDTIAAIPSSSADITNNSLPFTAGKEKLHNKIQIDNATASTPQQIKKLRKSLQFSTVEIREYNRILGDNPACSAGPPTQLDWDYNILIHTTLDEYEEKRAPSKSLLDLCLTPFLRRFMMHSEFGYSHDEINKACKAIQKTRLQRAKTKSTRGGDLLHDNKSWLSRKLSTFKMCLPTVNISA